MSSKIEQLIDEIEDYIDNCKFKALSNTQIIVNKEEIDELLRELRLKTPEEIKRYQKIISNKEAILNDAREKASALINEATLQTNELINEHEIMQQAYAQANEVVTLATNQAQEILDNATNDANNIRMAAIEYTDNSLKSVEEILTRSISNYKTRYEGLLNSLQESLDVVVANRSELVPMEMEQGMTEAVKDETPAQSEAPVEDLTGKEE